MLPKAKLVYLTMNQDLDIASEAFRLGASAYLLKPLRPPNSSLPYAMRCSAGLRDAVDNETSEDVEVMAVVHQNLNGGSIRTN